MYLIETNELCKQYAGKLVVNHVNMHIPEASIYGFVGENGSGKTTIMRLLTGLAEPTSGSFSLFGVGNKDKRIYKERQKLSAIVETVSQVPTLTARDNIIFQELYLGIKLTDEERQALLEKVHLGDVGNKKVKNFSLGMRQRLGIALALINKPKLMLLDEPMNGLDPKGFIDVRETILKLNKKGVTFLISSHILSELDKICTRVGFLTHGRLVKEIDFDELHQLARKKIVIRVKNSEKVSKDLAKEFNLKEVNLDGEFISIYDTLDINEVMKYLVNKGIKVESISSSEETIEDFYQQLVNGGNK